MPTKNSATREYAFAPGVVERAGVPKKAAAAAPPPPHFPCRQCGLLEILVWSARGYVRGFRPNPNAATRRDRDRGYDFICANGIYLREKFLAAHAATIYDS